MFSQRIPYLLLLLALLFPKTASAQVWEDFSDGDFTNSPSWVGDTDRFVVNNSRQLQLHHNGADSSWLSFPYSMPSGDTLTWTFWLRLNFSPTANNYAMVALYSDSADLLAASHYLALAIIDPSQSGKKISLYQDDALLTTLSYSPSANNNKLRFRIQMIAQQQLSVWIDTLGGDVPDYSINDIVSATAASVPVNAHFGLYCRYTSSRSQHFYIDDIGINQNSAAINNTQPPPLSFGDVLVNEVLFNPYPRGADYVELYNNTDSSVALSRLCLAKMSDDTIQRLYPVATSGSVAPHDFIVITTNSDYVRTTFTVPHPERLTEVSSMPSYNDKEGTVVVCADTVILDRLDYSEKMHSRLLHDVEGVALERRSFSAPTQMASNWYSAASTAGFGTPTAPNSQSHEFLFVDDDFAIDNTLFSPDGDGYNDLLVINYRLEDCSLSTNISIYDAAGRLVCKLARAALLGCWGSLSWDGINDNGEKCPRGSYLLVIEAYNESGTSQNWRRTISLVRR